MVTNVSIDISWGWMEIQTTRPRFEARRELPEVQVTNERPQVSADATDYRSAMGLHTSRALTREIGADAEQATRDGIDRIVSEGDALGRVDNGASDTPIADIAARRLLDPPPDVQLTWLPLPDIDVEGGVPDVVDVSPGSLEIEHHVEAPRFAYHPTTVSVDTEVHNVNVRA